jgi:hypothetical protein
LTDRPGSLKILGMIPHILRMFRSPRLLGWGVMVLLATAFGFSFAGLKVALDQREAFPAALDRLEKAGLATRQERRTLDVLGDVFERSTARIAILTEAGTSPSAAPLGDQELLRWRRDIGEQRARAQNDLAFLALLSGGTPGMLAGLVKPLHDQLDEEDRAWEVVAQYLAARHDGSSAAREDELLRQFSSSLMRISQAVSAFRQRIHYAAARNARVAGEDDARLNVLLAQVEYTKQSITMYQAIGIVTLVLLAVALGAMFLPWFVGREA